ncbi:hypothetical protein AB1Y20_009657 [Prymnesium parvum]|uniref:J domain-containing protein n=1 Tax=Prymnesium parvum TaxID=97485 RepID=A0AB34K5V8_PRYPA
MPRSNAATTATLPPAPPLTAVQPAATATVDEAEPTVLAVPQPEADPLAVVEANAIVTIADATVPDALAVVATSANLGCPHGRRRSLCKDCGGTGICEHGRRRQRCKDCGGNQICEHHRVKSKCKDCGGSSICEHKRRRSECKDCGGAGICEHKRRRAQCKDCGGKGFCVHGRQPSRCKDCGGKGICEHGRVRTQCKDCGGSSICEHRRVRTLCHECGGKGICVHGRQRYGCKECKAEKDPAVAAELAASQACGGSGGSAAKEAKAAAAAERQRAKEEAALQRQSKAEAAAQAKVTAATQREVVVIATAPAAVSAASGVNALPTDESHYFEWTQRLLGANGEKATPAMKKILKEQGAGALAEMLKQQYAAEHADQRESSRHKRKRAADPIAAATIGDSLSPDALAVAAAAAGEPSIDALIAQVLRDRNTPHLVLGVAADAPVAAVRKRYLHLLMRLHPTKQPHAQANEAFNVVEHAYENFRK